jgi:hypothetical protein
MIASRSGIASRTRARGQAMTEFVMGVTLFALPVFLLIPLVGKYLDIRATAVQAARYVAWERTVWYGGTAASVSWPAADKSSGAIQNEVRQRLFSEGTAIASSDSGQGDWGGSGAKANWTNRDGSPLLASYGAIGQSIANDDTPNIATDVVNLIVTVTDALGSFTLETKGLYTGGISVGITTLPINMSLDGASVFNPGALNMSESNTLLANGWSANGADHVKSQIQGLTPTAIFAKDPVKTVFEILKGVMAAVSVQELWFLELGKVEPDVVPPDRLTGP